jgi:hypothetical protein
MKQRKFGAPEKINDPKINVAAFQLLHLELMVRIPFLNHYTENMYE